MNTQELIKAAPQLKDKTLILCEHQKKGSSVEYIQWIGDKTRVVLCPICTGVVFKDSVMMGAAHFKSATEAIERVPNMQEIKARADKYDALLREHNKESIFSKIYRKIFE